MSSKDETNAGRKWGLREEGGGVAGSQGVRLVFFGVCGVFFFWGGGGY